MKTLEQLKTDFVSRAIDNRDIHRLLEFIPYEYLEHFGVEVEDTEAEWNSTLLEYTEENVLKQLKCDVDFGFDKALNRRGLSAGLMFGVVQMWNTILENELADWPDNNYAQYGLPLLKATALLYNFNNPIGDDAGDEDCYAEDPYE